MTSSSSLRWIFCHLPIAAIIFLANLPVNAGSLSTVERKMNTYARGEVTFTCLELDGGIVPLNPPDEAKWQMLQELTLFWAKDNARAIFRLANEKEKTLLAEMKKPDAIKLWETTAASLLNDVPTYSVREFQPDFMPVNKWRIGAITLDYLNAGVESSSLLLLWQTQDGTSIAITLKGGTKTFNEHREEIYRMIGSSLLREKAAK